MSVGFSVEFSYPSLPQTPPSFLPTPLRPCSSVSNRIRCPSGTVGFYDITELSERIRYFGVSEETKRAITRKQKTERQLSKSSTAVRRTPRETLSTNKNTLFKSLPHLSSSNPSTVTRSCYVDFTGSFHDKVQARPLALATRHSAPVIRHHCMPTSSSKVTTRCKRREAKTQETCAPESVAPFQVKDGLLVIANGKIIDLKSDIKRSEKLEENERKRLRKEMRKHFDIVRSFDDLIQELGDTKLQLEKLKTA